PAGVVVSTVSCAFREARVVLGPVVGRVTAGSAIVLVETGGQATVGCVVTDSITGVSHRQV
ncbi:unnamed protein product, partial [Discosporangium mesarthrocarpum]